MDKLLNSLGDIRKRAERVYRFVVLICGFLLLLLMAANVFVRIFPVASMHWFDEIVELLFAWMVFLGSAVLYSRKDHFMIDWIAGKTEGTRFGFIYRIIIEALCLIFVLIFLVQSTRLTVLARDWTAVFNFPKRILYASMPIAGVLMVFSGFLDIISALFSLKRKPAIPELL